MTAPTRPTQSALELTTSVRPNAPCAARHASPRITARFEGSRERDRVVAWLEAGLRPGRSGRLVREYPLLFEANSAAIPITVWAEGRPASFCFLWPVPFELTKGRLRTGLISLVYTDPRDRGRGLARAAIARALREARARDLGVCLLWSQLADFYASQGFSRAGQESLLVVDPAVLGRARARLGTDTTSRPKVERARPEDWPAIAAMRARRACHAPLPANTSALAAIPELDARVARGPDGILAFALCGRGDDFQGVVHEWGGEPGALLDCCEALLDESGRDAGLLILAPRYAEPSRATRPGNEPSELAHCLRAAGARRIENPLGWFAVASLPALVADLARLAPALGAALHIEASTAGPSALPGVLLTERASGRACSLSMAALLSLLFSGDTDPTRAAARSRLESIVPSTALADLPLPFFVWGLESI